METRTVSDFGSLNPQPASIGESGSAGIVSDRSDKYPPLCGRCGKQFETFDGGPDHPDTGVDFACGLMVEGQGVGYLGCAHFSQKKARHIDAILDAEECNRALVLVAQMRTSGRRMT